MHFADVGCVLSALEFDDRFGFFERQAQLFRANFEQFAVYRLAGERGGWSAAADDKQGCTARQFIRRFPHDGVHLLGGRRVPVVERQHRILAQSLEQLAKKSPRKRS